MTREEIGQGRNGTYKDDLFDDVGASDFSLSVFLESAVSHHGVLDTIVLIVDRDYHRVVVFDVLSELESHHVVEIEND